MLVALLPGVLQLSAACSPQQDIKFWVQLVSIIEL